MKKIGSFLPVLTILFIAVMGPRLLAGGMNPARLIILGGLMILIVVMIRPMKAATKSLQQIQEEVLDDFCENAFADNEALEKRFLSALSDAGRNMPKSAASKLRKLTDECTTDRQRYAVALASAYTARRNQDWKTVIREYNKAIVLNPSADMAYKIGDAHQRLGNLDKARDSYEFAMELDPANPQYPSSLATACVGDGYYTMAQEYAQDALDLDPNFPQALATMAICYGLQEEPAMYKFYLDKAFDNGYSMDKIESTVKALKKRNK